MAPNTVERRTIHQVLVASLIGYSLVAPLTPIRLALETLVVIILLVSIKGLLAEIRRAAGETRRLLRLCFATLLAQVLAYVLFLAAAHLSLLPPMFGDYMEHSDSPTLVLSTWSMGTLSPLAWALLALQLVLIAMSLVSGRRLSRRLERDAIAA